MQRLYVERVGLFIRKTKEEEEEEEKGIATKTLY